MAVVIQPLGGNKSTIGMFVDVLQVEPNHLFRDGGRADACLIRVPCPVPSSGGNMIQQGWAMDANLQPIRGRGKTEPAGVTIKRWEPVKL
jgi:hypothetical protein